MPSIRRSRSRQTRKTKPPKKNPGLSRIQRNGPLEFPEVKGKVVEAVKLYLQDDASISIFFADKTQLCFDLEPGLTVRTDLSDWKTHNWRPIKRWPPVRSVSTWKH